MKTRHLERAILTACQRGLGKWSFYCRQTQSAASKNAGNSWRIECFENNDPKNNLVGINLSSSVCPGSHRLGVVCVVSREMSDRPFRCFGTGAVG